MVLQRMYRKRYIPPSTTRNTTIAAAAQHLTVRTDSHDKTAQVERAKMSNLLTGFRCQVQQNYQYPNL